MFGGSSGTGRPLPRRSTPSTSPRPARRSSAWPIGKADLDPYHAATDDPRPRPVGGTRRTAGPRAGSAPAIQCRWSPPTRFAEKYRDEIAAGPRIASAVNANLVDLRLDDGLAAVTGRCSAPAPGDPGFTVQARRYALCLGGLENPGSLLNCRSQVPGGIGNAHDLVGRYFCEHPARLLRRG